MTTDNTTQPTVGDMTKKLSPEEAQSIQRLHQQAQNLVHHVGQLEVRKHQAMTELQSIELAAKSIMDQVAARFGIPSNQPWQIKEDGQVVLIDPQTGQPVGVPNLRVVPDSQQ